MSHAEPGQIEWLCNNCCENGLPIPRFLRPSLVKSDQTWRGSRLTLLLAFCAVIVLCRVLATSVLFIYDDAFITFRYAHNVASGFGLVYNPGEHVLGTTAPAFALLLSIIEFIGLDLTLAVPALNIFLDGAIFFLAVRLFLRGQPSWQWALLAGLLALSPIMTRVTLGAMELNCFLFLALLCIDLYIGGRRRGATIIATLLYFVRPESVALVAVFCLFEFKSEGLRAAFRLAAISAATVVLPLLAAYLFYGHVLSQSILAKSTRSGSSIPEILQKVFLSDPVSMAALPFWIYGALRAWRRGVQYQIVILWLGVHLALYLIGRPYFASWYGEIFYFGILLFATFGIGELSRSLKSVRVTEPIGWAMPVLAIGAWLYLNRTESPSPVTEGIHHSLQSWCRSHPMQSATITARDVGAIGYYSNAYIYDVDGLVSPQMVQYHGTQQAWSAPHSEYLYVAGEGREAEGLPYTTLARFTGSTAIRHGLISKGWNGEYVLLRRAQ